MSASLSSWWRFCLYFSVLNPGSFSAPSPHLAVRLTALRLTIATKVPPRVLLPTVTKCYARLVQDQKNQLVALMSILQEHIGHMDRDQLTLHQSELTTFFLTALDFRAMHCQEDLEKAQKVEGAVIDCLLALVLKLSEVTFRPLFFKVILHLGTPDQHYPKERVLTLVRLCDAVALRLKGLFVLFSGNLLPLFCDLLTLKTPLFQLEEKTSLLVSLVLDCLHKICLYDTHKFLSRERAEALMTPLVDQLENLQGGEGEYQRRVAQSLVPCLGQFAVALADDSQWKSLNYQVLLKTRHTDHKVRLSALASLLELCSKLRENYLVLLPETVPFLAELMEDENEEVEKEVQRVVQEMENVLGEPLQTYF
uniref:HEAT repeat-containing protein 1 n=1 Tax=Periophthalmus magnuspinnatus TaxID=409849 RepID=A0A3B4AWU5_9GOBI